MVKDLVSKIFWALLYFMHPLSCTHIQGTPFLSGSYKCVGICHRFPKHWGREKQTLIQKLTWDFLITVNYE